MSLFYLTEKNNNKKTPVFPFSSAKTRTFESICGSWSKVLVGVKLEGQLPVRLLQIFIAGVFGNTKDFIKVLAILYPAITKHNGRQNIWDTQ